MTRKQFVYVKRPDALLLKRIKRFEWLDEWRAQKEISNRRDANRNRPLRAQRKR